MYRGHLRDEVWGGVPLPNFSDFVCRNSVLMHFWHHFEWVDS